jgi:hypothetical protein
VPRAESLVVHFHSLLLLFAVGIASNEFIGEVLRSIRIALAWVLAPLARGRSQHLQFHDPTLGRVF